MRANVGEDILLTMNAKAGYRFFGWGDMLMPGPLLECTNWRDNPLVQYSMRRGRKPWRWLWARIVEIILLIGAMFIIGTPFSFFYMKSFLTPAPGSLFLVANAPIPYQATPLITALHFVASYLPGIWFFITFLLLRYHLLINDQSNHMKNLSRERLAELLLTRLRGEEFFLHYLLMFCHRYRVLVAWAVLWGIAIAADILLGEIAWIQSGMWHWLFATFFVVMFTWVGGVYQYVFEWKRHAGGAARRWRPLLSMAYSAVIAIVIWYLTCTGSVIDAARHIRSISYVGVNFWTLSPYEFALGGHGASVLGGVIGWTIAFLCAIAHTYKQSRMVYDSATRLLARQFEMQKPGK